MFNQPLSISNSMKLIRFFKVAAVFGGVVILTRIVIFIAIINGILYILP